MPPTEDVKEENAPDQAEAQEADEAEASAAISPAPEEEVHDVAPVGAAAPVQMGTRRFVFAAYFAGAIAIAFLSDKALELVWYRLQSWKPAFGDPQDHEEIILALAALIAVVSAIYYWYRTRARQLAEEVATEMSKVTWPTRTEVTNGTFVVLVATLLSTVFFALMDKFWAFVTNLVYGGG